MKHFTILSNNKELRNLIEKHLGKHRINGGILYSKMIEEFKLPTCLEYSFEEYAILSTSELTYLLDKINSPKSLEELSQAMLGEDNQESIKELLTKYENNKYGVYHLFNVDNNGYDTFSDIIVIAPSENVAREIHPYSFNYPNRAWSDYSRCWANSPETVIVEKIGFTNTEESKIICTSFHAG